MDSETIQYNAWRRDVSAYYVYLTGRAYPTGDRRSVLSGVLVHMWDFYRPTAEKAVWLLIEAGILKRKN
jgi:hypothetical protein